MAGARRRFPRQPPEEVHVGPAEAVDRLFGVAYDHQGARRLAGQEPRDLHLERVRVLELVDDQEAEARAEVAADPLAVAQRVARLEEEVEVVEDAALGLQALVPLAHAGQGGHDPAVQRGAVRRLPSLQGLPAPLGDGPRLVDVRPAPARPLAADVAGDVGHLQEPAGRLRGVERARLGGERRELLQAAGEGVAVGRPAQDGAGALRVLVQVALPRARVFRRLHDQRPEVALLDEGAGEAAQRGALAEHAHALQRDVVVQRLEQDVVALHQAVGQPLLPGRGEEQVGLGLVGRAEAREDAALERPLGEDRRAQGVDGGDLRPLQDVQGLARAPALGRRRGRVGPGPLQPLAQAELHGGGGVLGEGDGRDLLEPRVPAPDEGLDAVDE